MNAHDREARLAGLLIFLMLALWLVLFITTSPGCASVPCYACAQADLVGEDPKCALGPCARADAGR